MASAPLALQWSLDQSATSTLSLSRGLIAAATSDNVQPLALVASERFGGSLIICSETRAKVERLIKTPKPVATFLGAYIGYSAGDCASQLVKSVAGVQFLSLAAALVSTMGTYQSSLALEAMLWNSAMDKTQTPPASHLQALLSAVEYRCVHSSFAETVVYCRNLLVDLQLNSPEDRQFWRDATSYPDANSMGKLMEAFHKIKTSPISEKGFLDLKTGRAAPWVIAFTKWYMGEFPSVYLEGAGPILEVPNSTVTVILTSRGTLPASLDICFRQNLDTPADLISTQISLENWSGMVKIRQYGEWLLRELDISQQTTTMVLLEVLPYALRQAVELSRTATEAWPVTRVNQTGVFWSLQSSTKPLNENLLPLVAIPFGKDAVISNILSHILGGTGPTTGPTTLRSLPTGSLLRDLPVFDRFLCALRESCTCPSCSPTFDYRLNTWSAQCLTDRFYYNIARIVIDILCLSLFNSAEAVLVSLHPQRHRTQFVHAIYTILTTGVAQVYSIGHVFDCTTSLVGHDHAHYSAPLSIMSSGKGQVIYPRIFATNVVPTRGYLEFSVAPGRLLFQGKVYDVALERIATQSRPKAECASVEVKAPRNLFPAHYMLWEVVERKTHLEIILTCRDERDVCWVSTSSPRCIFENISRALFLQHCQHSPDEPLVGNSTSTYTAPTSTVWWDKEGPPDVPRISCVAVDGDDGLRMCALGNHEIPAVMRGRACLLCALEVCLQAKYPVLIL